MIASISGLPDRLHNAEQVRALDAQLIAAGVPGFELIQRAAHATWRAIKQRWAGVGEMTVLVGRGNNGADGYVIAALARHAGWQVRVLSVCEPSMLAGDAARARDFAIAAGASIYLWAAMSELRGVLVDALLGTGLRGPVAEPLLHVIEQVNASPLPVVAVDIPSGLQADTGAYSGAAIRAHLTVTYIALKLGLLTGEGPQCCGELLLDELGVSAEVLRQTPAIAERITLDNVARLPARRRTVHKGQLGHVLVVGGDCGMGGAALLSSQAALRAGAGLVSLATRAEHAAAALSRSPEVMCLGVQSAGQLLPLLERASVCVAGPGLGCAAWGRSLISAVAHRRCLHVWDADALNLLAAGQVNAPACGIITPHPAEAARLLGVSTAQVQADRPAAAKALAEKYSLTVILKGAGTLVASADGRLALCDRGHPAMAGAGLGDVLAGLCGALLAQGLDCYPAACLAVWLHACAGERLAQQGRGLAASDMPQTIRLLLEEYCPC